MFNPVSRTKIAVIIQIQDVFLLNLNCKKTLKGIEARENFLRKSWVKETLGGTSVQQGMPNLLIPKLKPVTNMQLFHINLNFSCN